MTTRNEFDPINHQKEKKKKKAKEKIRGNAFKLITDLDSRNRRNLLWFMDNTTLCCYICLK